MKRHISKSWTAGVVFLLVCMVPGLAWAEGDEQFTLLVDAPSLTLMNTLDVSAEYMFSKHDAVQIQGHVGALGLQEEQFLYPLLAIDRTYGGSIAYRHYPLAPFSKLVMGISLGASFTEGTLLFDYVPFTGTSFTLTPMVGWKGILPFGLTWEASGGLGLAVSDRHTTSGENALGFGGRMDLAVGWSF